MQKVHDSRARAPGGFDAKKVVARIVGLVRSGELDLPEETSEWKSGVYCLVDAVFRARCDHASVVLPMLRDRLAARTGMRDRVTLRFRDLLADVDTMRGDKVEAYSTQVLNRQRIAGRRKTAIVCEAAQILSEQGLETRKQLLRLHSFDLESVALGDLADVTGFGEGLGRHFLWMLGHDDSVRPDREVRRFLGRLTAWQPQARSAEDDAYTRSVLASAGRRLRVMPLRLIAGIHRYEAVHRQRGKE